MAKKSDYESPKTGGDNAAQTPPQLERTSPRLIEEEMKESYLNYAMSVIVGRALPDVRDGLKPVHRRILFAMSELGLPHNKPFKKSARIVGEVLGKFHPHGDTAVYDSLVRMVQDFSLRYPLVDGQGNFGSMDGDAPAAMRYTEARLTKIAEETLADIEKETVPFVPNFDGSLTEPSVLPSKIPNLLVNGSSGIAVGMATNIPPHNITEVCAGCIALIEKPEISIEEIMQLVTGPDFPTGGIICGKRGIAQTYATGRGKVVIRAKTAQENVRGRECIVMTEIPYMVNKAMLIEQIADLVREKKVQGISDLRDESNKEGVRVIIELKKDANAEVVLNQLYKHSRLQQTFGTIMLALVNNEPRVLNLKQLIQEFITYRKEVIIKRTTFDLKKAEEKAHILEGLIIALDNIDAIITLLKKSNSVDAAKSSLMSRYSLSEKQSAAILDMRLQKLTSLEQSKIREEHTGLKKLVGELSEILASEARIYGIIKEELIAVKELYGDSRRTEIQDIDEEGLDIEDLIEKENVVITVSHQGYVKRMPIDTYRQQRRGGRGIVGANTKEEDFIENLFIANTHSYILCFSSTGQVYWLKVYKIPEASRQAAGKAIVNLLELKEGEKISAMIPIDEFDDKHYLLMCTKKGTIKKTNLMAYARPRQGGIIGITLEQDDELVEVVKTDGKKEIIIATKSGMAVRFQEKDARPIGRASMGVRGITLEEKDEVIGMVLASEGKTLLTITENGYGKRTAVQEYRLIRRGGSGVINIQCSERNGSVITIKSVTSHEDIMLISKNGILIRMPVKDISVIGRNTQGVRLMKLEESDVVVAAAKLAESEELPQEDGLPVSEAQGAGEEATEEEKLSGDGYTVRFPDLEHDNEYI